MIYESVKDLIGKTPLLKVPAELHGLKNVNLYAKLEYYNPFGSVKDRIALSMIEPFEEEIKAQKKTIIEASSGNTGKALAALAGIMGVEFTSVTNRIKVPETRMLLQALGTQIHELPGLSDCPDPNDPNDFTTYATNMAKAEPEKYFYTDQYFNELNFQAHYEGTGKEIYEDMPQIDYFAGFLGTCGSTMGAGTYLKERKSDLKTIGIVAGPGQSIPGGRNVNELWEVSFFKKSHYDFIVDVNSAEAVDGMLELNRQAGMFCGPTTGANYVGIKKVLSKIAESSDQEINVVFIACDRVEQYMSYIKKYRPEIFEKRSQRKTVFEQTEAEIASAKSISANELEQLIKDTSKKKLVYDVRGNFAYKMGHVPDSLNMLDEVLAQWIEEDSVIDKNYELVFVCNTDKISKKFASFMEHRGYKAAFLAGGINAWKESGLTLVRTI